MAFGIDYLPKGLWDAYYLSSGVLTAGVAIPVFAMFWKRADLPGAFAGSLVGGLTAFIGYFVEKYVFEYDYWPGWLSATALGYAVWGVIAGVVTCIVVSLLTKAPSRSVSTPSPRRRSTTTRSSSPASARQADAAADSVRAEGGRAARGRRGLTLTLRRP